MQQIWQRLSATMVIRSPLTTMVWIWLRLQAACGMSFTLHSQCLVVFPLGFSSPLRRAQNCSDWNHLMGPTGLARTCSGWCKINGFTFYLMQPVEPGSKLAYAVISFPKLTTWWGNMVVGGYKANIILGQVILIRSKIMTCINIYQNLWHFLLCSL